MNNQRYKVYVIANKGMNRKTIFEGYSDELSYELERFSEYQIYAPDTYLEVRFEDNQEE